MTARRTLKAVAAAVALLTVSSVGWLWFSGWRAFIVHTGSMSPSIPSGDLIVDRPAHSTKVGSVITFAKAPGQYTTHRVVGVTPSGMLTRGDANPSNDFGFVTSRQVAGRVEIVVPFAGYLARFFGQPTALAGMLLSALALWLAWRVFDPMPVAERDARPSQ